MIIAVILGMVMICMAIIAAMVVPRYLTYRLEVLREQENAREASHRRSLELSRSLEPASELELDTRREEARARQAEAQARMQGRRNR